MKKGAATTQEELECASCGKKLPPGKWDLYCEDCYKDQRESFKRQQRVYVLRGER